MKKYFPLLGIQVCVCEGGGSPVADAAMFVWVLPLSIDDTPFYFTAAI